MSTAVDDSVAGPSDRSNALHPLAIAIPVLALPSCVLCILTLTAHIKARNLAASILVIGVGVVNFQNFINALIWPSDLSLDKWDGKGLCDVEVKLYIGFANAIVGAIASIFRQLAIILDTENATIIPSKVQRFRTLFFEMVLCVGVPVYLMAVHYVVQLHRYWLVTISGCTPSFHSSWPSYVLIFIWPVIVALIGAAYCSLAVFRLIRYRRRIYSILSSSSSITKARYIRLFSLAAVLLMVYLPLFIYTVTANLGYPQYPYRWSVVHPPGWSNDIPRYSLGQGYNGFDRWVQIGTGYLVFLFTGLGHDAIVMYKSWLIRIGLTRFFLKLDSNHDNLGVGTRSSSATSPLVARFSRSRPKDASRRENTTEGGSISDTELATLGHGS